MKYYFKYYHDQQNYVLCFKYNNRIGVKLLLNLWKVYIYSVKTISLRKKIDMHYSLNMWGIKKKTNK